MPKLKNLKHEAVAEKYAKAILSDTETPVKGKIYAEVYGAVTEDSAYSAGARLFGKVDLKSRISEILASSGIPLERLIKKYDQLSEANKDVVSDGKVFEVRDNSTQLECLKLGLKMYGAIQEGATVNDNRSINFNITPESAERLSAIVNEMKALNASDADADSK